jgi:hypothetical protein
VPVNHLLSIFFFYQTDFMNAHEFILLKSIQGQKHPGDFDRKKGKYCIPGVYFWGFTLRDDCNLPRQENELIIYYIGKSKSNVSERIMQEITQLLFGGFGTIIDKDWLEKHYCNAVIKNEQDKKPCSVNVLYKSKGLHVLNYFFTTPKILNTINWMRERLIFTWICCDPNEVGKLEKEMHHIVSTNVFGVGNAKNLKRKSDICDSNETPFFNKQIDWKANPILKQWLIEVNKKIV